MCVCVKRTLYYGGINYVGIGPVVSWSFGDLTPFILCLANPLKGEDPSGLQFPHLHMKELATSPLEMLALFNTDFTYPLCDFRDFELLYIVHLCPKVTSSPGIVQSLGVIPQEKM